MEVLGTHTSLANISFESTAESGQDSTGRPGSNILVIFAFSIRSVLIPVICVLSFTSGVLNVAVFSKTDLSQGVNQNLLILSASDCVMNFLLLSIMTLRLTILSGHTGGGLLPLLAAFFLSVSNGPLYVSLIVTTVIAVVRCCSIMMPLSFRRIFTARRQLVVIFGCTFITIGLLSYILVMFYRPDFTFLSRPRINGSNVAPNFSRRRTIVNVIFDSYRNLLFYSCFGIITVSMVFLTVALKKSSKFQRQATSTGTGKTLHRSSTKTSATREAQVIKTVVLVLAIFVMCNVPLMLLAFLRLALPGFNAFGNYYVFYIVLNYCVEVTVGLNTGLNFFVYYNCNSQFRQIVKSMFRIEKTEKEEFSTTKASS